MDFHPVALDTASNAKSAIDFILKLPISRSDKVTRIKKVLDLIGSDFYVQMFGANSVVFDSASVDVDMDYGEMQDMVGRLATKVERQYYGNRVYESLIREFYDTALGKAQKEAFENAISLDKHPTLTRSMVGETCKWCQSLAGVHVNPDGEYFARHDNCDCLIVASGYGSRNGVVNNYKKVTNSPSREAHLEPTLKRLRNYDETTAKFADVLEGQNRAELGRLTGDTAKTFGLSPNSPLLISRKYALHMDNSGHFAGTGFGKSGHDNKYPLSNSRISKIPIIVKEATKDNFINDVGTNRGLQRYEIISKDKQLVLVEISKNGTYVDVVSSYTLSKSQYRKKTGGAT